MRDLTSLTNEVHKAMLSEGVYDDILTNIDDAIASAKVIRKWADDFGKEEIDKTIAELEKQRRRLPKILSGIQRAGSLSQGDLSKIERGANDMAKEMAKVIGTTVKKNYDGYIGEESKLVTVSSVRPGQFVVYVYKRGATPEEIKSIRAIANKYGTTANSGYAQMSGGYYHIVYPGKTS